MSSAGMPKAITGPVPGAWLILGNLFHAKHSRLRHGFKLPGLGLPAPDPRTGVGHRKGMVRASVQSWLLR